MRSICFGRVSGRVLRSFRSWIGGFGPILRGTMGAPIKLLWFLIITGVALCGGYLFAVQNMKRPARMPIESVVLRFEVDVRQRIVSVLNDYAAENKFNVRIARIHPSRLQYGVNMFRSDVEISGDNLGKDDILFLGFYAPQDGTYKKEIVEDAYGKLQEKMKAYLIGENARR